METNGTPSWLDSDAGQQLQATLSQEQTLLGLNRLLNRLDKLENSVERLNALLEQGPAMLSMATDTIDESVQKASSKGIDVEARLQNALTLAEKLTAPEMVGRLEKTLTFADQLPGMASMFTDMVDEGYRRAAEKGVDLEQRMGQALTLAEKLTSPEMVDKLDSLMKLADQAPGLLSMVTDMADESVRGAYYKGIDVESRLKGALTVAEKLTDPEMVGQLENLLKLAKQAPGLAAMTIDIVDEAMTSSTMSHVAKIFDPEIMATVGDVGTALSEAVGQPIERRNLWGLMKAMRDPELQTAIGFLINFGRNFGKKLTPNK
ncbi:MAG: DUF1641 domain-containing protein [Bacteroidetes bacterium]|nr:DUF1641 domain-containing protein [Bacteroidota bacterium]